MLRSLTRSAGAVLLAFPFLASSASAGGVRIVDATGARNFPDIQSAIDAAVDGDVLLVGAGTYAGFTLDGKSLSILAAPAGAPVSISTGVTVRNVSGSCLLAGFTVGPPASPYCGLGLSVRDCTGIVAFENCAFRGSVGAPIGYPCVGYSGAEIRNGAAVVLSGCSFEGGMGASFVSPALERGGQGCLLDSSTAAAYECVFRGGQGGTSQGWAGEGGDGLHALSSWLFAAGSTFLGGDGGDGTNPSAHCGSPGSGLVAEAGSSAHLLQPAAAGGAGGSNCIPGGSSAAYRGAGAFDFLPGTARSFDTPVLSVDRDPWSLAVAGVPGDEVFLNRSPLPVFSYEPSLAGVCTALLPPFPTAPPLGIVPASGNLALDVPQPLLPDGTVAELQFLQGYSIDPAGTVVLGSPMHVLSLNWNSQPDWNGNGVNDYAEVIAGTSRDWNHDLIPDSGGVRIVDATGTRNFLDVQPAIDAAVDGDVLLVGEGVYPGFTLDGKSLSILAAPPGAQVSVTSRVSVRNVSGSSLLAGLSVTPSAFEEALSVANCTGDVRFQDCSLRGHDGPCNAGSCSPGSPAADISLSASVVLVGCHLVAGGAPDGGLYGLDHPGAPGLSLHGSTVALYDTSSAGGEGPDAHHDDMGPGGAGVLVAGSWLFASRCSFQGGQGGDDLSDQPFLGGACGGAGVSVDGSSTFTSLDVAATGGPGGAPAFGCGSGPDIDNQGGQLALLPGAGRRFALASICADSSFWRLSVAGVAGDKLFLNSSLAPHFQYEPSLSGVCTAVLPPFLSAAPLGVLRSSVGSPLRVPQRLLPDPVVARVYNLQGYVIDSAGATFLGSPMHVLSLNWNSLPDCNANGINDYAEVIAGITPDADHDLKPDGCP